jgi:Chromo (CHRromatin Organisation MOdifier) domain
MGIVEASASDRPPAVDPEDNQYKVEKLVRKRRKGRKVQYWAKWLGYPDSENTWEAQQDIDPEIVAAFDTSSVC